MAFDDVNARDDGLTAGSQNFFDSATFAPMDTVNDFYQIALSDFHKRLGH